MKKILKYVIPALILCIIAFVYYYITLPAINIHSTGFWGFIIGLFILLTIVLAVMSGVSVPSGPGSAKNVIKFNSKSLKSTLFKTSGVATLLLVIVFIIGSVLSSPIVNASKYQKLLTVTEGDFTEDIKEMSYDKIPLLDKESAALLGSRKMGSMVEFVSQFEIADNYTQINYQDTPVRVTPLEYASFFKWLQNRSNGIPAYMRINMATQNVECIKLEQGIRYSESEYFGRNINRHLRFKYPTYIFDQINFEIDDEGTPYYVCPVKDFKIGLFGGQSIRNVVLVNAITGEDANYAVKDVPTWVDRVYSSELLISYYDYYGTLKHGYWNTLFSQKDCLITTDGYNYIVLNDDVWVYTGVTSVVGDKSNVGFVIMNQRTAETRYYPITGAEEFSAMSSAEGQVQHLGYKATFPLLLNIADKPTYLIALKDESGLVKKYAMVNVEKYQIVAIGDTVDECEKTYIKLLKTSGITITDTTTLPSITGSISKIAEGVVEGNSHYYIMLNNSDAIFDVSVVDYIDIIKYNVGDMITLTYSEGAKTHTVLEIK